MKAWLPLHFPCDIDDPFELAPLLVLGQCRMQRIDATKAALRVECELIERHASRGLVDPTVAELGFPGFDLAATMGLFARGGTPVAIVERLQVGAAKAMREPDLVHRIEAIGMVIRENGTAHYAQMIQDETALYASLVRDLK